jgi:hypothetical protein
MRSLPVRHASSFTNKLFLSAAFSTQLAGHAAGDQSGLTPWDEIDLA